MVLETSVGGLRASGARCVRVRTFLLEIGFYVVDPVETVRDYGQDFFGRGVR